MVDQARRDRATNLGYNSFTPTQFSGAIMRGAELNPQSCAYSRHRVAL